MSGYTKEELIGKPGYLLQGAATNPETINYLKSNQQGHPLIVKF
jgi:hypothetical protein